MKASFVLAVSIVVLLLGPGAGGLGGTTPATAPAEDRVPGHVGLLLHAAPGSATTLYGYPVERTIPAANGAVLQVPVGSEAAVRDTLRGHPDVAEAFLPSLLAPQYTPNDPYLTDQWGVSAVGLFSAWDETLGNHLTRVAVLDTGTNRLHPDLKANLYTGDPGCGPDLNALNPLSGVGDVHGHGTHVAGIVAADVNNGIGVAGMSDACVQTVKVCNDQGRCPSFAVATGIVHAVATGADIISLSLGGSGDPLLEWSARHAWSQGVLVVAAAGNGGCSTSNTVLYPAAYQEVMAVGALKSRTERAGFSSCGDALEISAPGQSIFSTSTNGGYVWKSGTSMAAPHVSGIAALMKSANPTLTGWQMRCILDHTARPLGPLGVDIHYGWGRVDSARAVSAATDPGWVGCVKMSGP